MSDRILNKLSYGEVKQYMNSNNNTIFMDNLIKNSIKLGGYPQHDPTDLSLKLSFERNINQADWFNSNPSEVGRNIKLSRNGPDWQQVGPIISIPDSNKDINFGGEVKMNNDGTIIAVSDPFYNNVVGALRVYKLINNNWEQIGSIIEGSYPATKKSSQNIAINSNGFIVGEVGYYKVSDGSQRGHCNVYELRGNEWINKGFRINRDTTSGLDSIPSISLDDSGLNVALGYSFKGHGVIRVYNFKTHVDNGTTYNYTNQKTENERFIITEDVNTEAVIGNNYWIQIGNDIGAPDNQATFGRYISLNSEGNILAVASAGLNNSQGQVNLYLYNSNTDQWDSKGTISNFSNSYANSVSLNGLGNIIAVKSDSPFDLNGNAEPSKLDIYNNVSGNNWQRIGETITEALGVSDIASINRNGNVILVSNKNNNQVSVYYNNNENWDNYGNKLLFNEPTSISINGDGSYITVSKVKSHVAIYKINRIGDNNWSQVGSDIKGEGDNDKFGSSVSINGEGNIIAVASNNINQTDNFEYIKIYKLDFLNRFIQEGFDIRTENNYNSQPKVSINKIGNRVAIGDSSSNNLRGHVRVFEFKEFTEEEKNQAKYHHSSFTQDSVTQAKPLIITENTETEPEPTRFYWSQIGNDIDGNNGDNAGIFLSLNNDGKTLAIGYSGYDSEKGAIKIFEENVDGNWQQKGYDIVGIGSNDKAANLSVSADGNVIAISTNTVSLESNNIRIFKWCKYTTELQNSDTQPIIIIGNSETEPILDSFYWTQVGGNITPSFVYNPETSIRFLDSSLSLNEDGTIIAIGNYTSKKDNDSYNNRGSVRILKLDNDKWDYLGDIIYGEREGDFFGKSIQLSLDGTTLCVGAPNALPNDFNSGISTGSVYIYKFKENRWNQVLMKMYGKNNDEYLGSSISLNDDGSRLCVGAPHFEEGQVRLYELKW